MTTSVIDVPMNQELENVKTLLDAARMENTLLILELSAVRNERDLAQEQLRNRPFLTVQAEPGPTSLITIKVPPIISTTPLVTTPIDFMQTPNPLSLVGRSSWGIMETSVPQASWYQEDVERILAQRNKEYYKREKELYATVKRLFPKQAHTIKFEPQLHLIEARAREETEAFLQEHENATSLGGYEEVDVQKWKVAAILQNQPDWRKRWLVKHRNIKEYAEAPRRMRIDLVFCPTPRQYTWDDFKRHQRCNPNLINFPQLPPPPIEEDLPDEKSFLMTIESKLEKYESAPDPSIVITCKFLRLFQDCI